MVSGAGNVLNYDLGGGHVGVVTWSRFTELYT